ncbi:MAG TPA: hypothetical protein V6C57_02620 [Coleofasciculaceae cyanobacterium]
MMATVKKRSAAATAVSKSATAVSKSAIEQAGVLLTELPQKPKVSWSLREAVGLLQASIVIALNRGYTYEEVAALLGEQGINIAAPSLKRYLAAVKQEKALASKSRRGSKQAKASAALADSPNLSAVSSKAAVATLEQPTSKQTSKVTRTPKTTKTTKAKSEPKAEPKMAAKKTSAQPTARAKTPSRQTATRSRKKSDGAS